MSVKLTPPAPVDSLRASTSARPSKVESFHVNASALSRGAAVHRLSELWISRLRRSARQRSRCAWRTPVRHTRARSLRDGFAAFGLSLIVQNLRPVRRRPPLSGSVCWSRFAFCGPTKGALCRPRNPKPKNQRPSCPLRSRSAPSPTHRSAFATAADSRTPSSSAHDVVTASAPVAETIERASDNRPLTRNCHRPECQWSLAFPLSRPASVHRLRE